MQAQVLTERPLQLRGSAIARGLLRLGGWRLEFRGLAAQQGVIVVYPHTSNWDFIVGILAKWGLGLSVTFWGKDSLFRLPLFGAWLRWLGGVPVDRRVPQRAALDMTERMRAAREQGRFLWLALAPEGTRGKSDGWRLGFYRVAVQAGVPLGLATLDYRRRVVRLDDFWQLSGDMDADFAALAEVAARGHGCRAELAAPVRPQPRGEQP